MSASPTFKVRMRPSLPAAMPARDWLRLVVDERPTRNFLGALVANWRGELSVAAHLGQRVHVVPIARCQPGDGLHRSLPPDQQAILEGWMTDYAAGKFEAQCQRARAAAGEPGASGW